MRADRLGINNPNIYVLTETLTRNIFQQIEEIEPELVVIDSIQTLQTDIIDASPGSISQIRETTSEWLRYAKKSSVPVFLIGHITKEGQLAGPKLLEHMVDVVLQFEGDNNFVYRLLRAHKNRFGSTQELGIYEMQQGGLHEVANPSTILLTKSEEELSGTTIGVLTEGLRPMMIEIQALVSSAVYGTPQRSSTGFDARRLNMLLAVLEKRCGFRLGAKDVFLNITGGLKVEDPAIDLAVVAAILSSNEDISVSTQSCFAAEVGLTGEIRPVQRIAQRISEAQKLGFEEIYVSQFAKIDPKDFKIEVKMIAKIEELVSHLFG
jgi:DNA repair protein RadA/Sms